ncbi:hypothetical protein T281_16685 [Rhodomicrobium udaipurense JA643]|uniref:Uncharacterized protein n=1 Tax=Rhodomicrobium udaipurense TaxID=1202716 RepID=A0A8I1GHC2_9HYPH|nr:hypothetical protein [Rhodomicrobium udaipurense]KAI93441.1 hypothetical protein T281_16685 [Rhodomicrobium udaipurense JA643]MBJ7544056.1 hypothetical protein [Rhodomicrobium udaipurense]
MGHTPPLPVNPVVGAKRGLKIRPLAVRAAAFWARGLHRVNETLLRIAIVCIGLALTVALFVKPV